MALHEYKKCVKIIEEISEYLLAKNYRKFDLSVESSNTETKIVANVSTNGVSLTDQLKDDLFCSRDIELEEYGWELSDDIDNDCPLNTLGFLIDSYETSENDDTCLITFHRSTK